MANDAVTVTDLDGIPIVTVKSTRAFGAKGKNLTDAIFAEIREVIPTAVHPQANI